MKWVLLILGIFLLPCIVYALSKAMTWGRLQATKEFTEKYFLPTKPSKKENDNGKEQKEE